MSVTNDPAAEMGGRGASVLRHLLDGMDPDVQNRRHAAYEWAQARETLGRDQEAAALRERAGLTTS